MLNQSSSQVLSFPISFCIRSVVPSTLSSTFHQTFSLFHTPFFFSNIFQLSICDDTVNYVYCLQILFVLVLIVCFCLHPSWDNLAFFILEKHRYSLLPHIVILTIENRYHDFRSLHFKWFLISYSSVPTCSKCIFPLCNFLTFLFLLRTHSN